MQLSNSPTLGASIQAQSGSSAQNRDSLKSLIAFDVECTGLSGAPHLLELGAVRIEDGEVQDHFQSLVAPLVPIQIEAFHLHGIDEDQVRNAPFAKDVLEAFFEWAGDSALVAHNAKVDAHVLGFECARAGLTPPQNAIFDSLALARRAWPQAPDHRLDTLVEYLGLETDDLHRALSDATACWQVCAAGFEQLGAEETPGFEQLIAWSAKPTSIAQRMPGSPARKPSLCRKLEAARSLDQSIIFMYGDKSQPPARVEVTPRLLYRANQHDYLEAECQRSGTLRTYRVDRIIKVEKNQ